MVQSRISNKYAHAKAAFMRKMLNHAKVCIPEGGHKGNKSDRIISPQKTRTEMNMPNRDRILYSLEREEWFDSWNSTRTIVLTPRFFFKSLMRV